MISDKYLERLKVRISWMNVVCVAAVIAVRRRLIKAVFFFSDESSELLMENTSTRMISDDAPSLNHSETGHKSYLFHRSTLSRWLRVVRL